LDFVYKLFTFSLEYAIRKGDERQERMKLKEKNKKKAGLLSLHG
jgi:hypothetical protein